MSNDQTRARLLGTWKLLSAVREDVSSGAKTDLLGANPIGYINYAPDGCMMVINVGGERPKPATGSATSAEAEALFRSMTSYAGTYTIRRQRNHPSRRCVMERKPDRHPAEALRPLRG
jgi:lipocalin-like protein